MASLEMPEFVTIPVPNRQTHGAGEDNEDGNSFGGGEGFMSGPVSYWRYHRRMNRLHAMGAVDSTKSGRVVAFGNYK